MWQQAAQQLWTTIKPAVRTAALLALTVVRGWRMAYEANRVRTEGEPTDPSFPDSAEEESQAKHAERGTGHHHRRHAPRRASVWTVTACLRRPPASALLTPAAAPLQTPSARHALVSPLRC